MEVSRIIFTKETQDKMNRGLNKKQLGALKWERLTKLYESGELQKMRNRSEVAKAIGYTDAQKELGYGWVANMVNRHYLDEVHVGFDKNNKPEYQYFLTKNKPNYGPHRKKSNKSSGKIPAANTPKPMDKPAEQIILSRASVETTCTKVTITRGDVVITMDNVDPETLIKIVMGVVRGEQHVEDVAIVR